MKKKSNKYVMVILCGGYGSRLWPLSTPEMPKQFAKILDGKSILQEIVFNFQSLVFPIAEIEELIIVSSEDCKYIIEDQLGFYKGKIKLLLEPFSKNTFYSIALASHYVANKFGDIPMLICPCDNLFNIDDHFNIELSDAISYSFENIDKLIILTTKPKSIKNLYGFVKITPNENKSICNEVVSFYEKPSLKKTKSFFTDPNFLWSTGTFLVNSTFVINNLSKIDQKLSKIIIDLHKSSSEKFGATYYNKDNFVSLIPFSFDSFFITKLDKRLLGSILISSSWFDLGCFSGLEEFLNHANLGDNFIISNRDDNVNIIHSSKPIATSGLKDITILDLPGIIFISKNKNFEQLIIDTRNSHPKLNNKFLETIYSYRPWGKFNLIYKDTGLWIKKIFLNPGSEISLQKHNFRSEIWLVLDNEILVSVSGENKVLKTGDVITIPVGVVHKMTNNTKLISIILEIGHGKLVEDSDIIRFTDIYLRD